MPDPARLKTSLRNPGGLIVFTDRLHLRLTGPDASRYLNGQISNRLPDANLSLPACVTNAKGKLEAVVHVSRLADGFHLDADSQLAPTLQARLERYAISDEVELEDVSSRFVLLHFLTPPQAPSPDTAALDRFEIRKSSRLGMDGRDVLLPVEELSSVLAGLPTNVRILEEEVVETLRIQNGVPSWGRELDNTILPPEAGLDRTAVDFHKGCYVGQEIISRIKSVGHVNKMLCRLISDRVIPPGTKLLSAATGEDAGVVTSSAQSFDLDKAVALGYVKRGWTTSGTLLLATDTPDMAENACPVEVHALHGEP